jgi:3-hydroxyacyl-[acyl-carrier-protein] dehydratase
MRFVLIDQITSLVPGQSISAIKSVSLAEEYLKDHFPGFAVLPGVMMVEALTQTGAWYMRHAREFRYSTVLLKSAKGIRYANFVTPGKILNLSMQVHGWDGPECTFKGSGTVDGVTVVSGRLTLTQFNLADRCAELQSADENQIAAARRLFSQLWRPSVAAELPAQAATAG